MGQMGWDKREVGGDRGREGMDPGEIGGNRGDRRETMGPAE